MQPKLFILSIFFLISFFCAAQKDREIEVSFTETTIIDALPQLKTLTGYSFAYGNEIDLSCSFNVVSSRFTIDQLLDKVFNSCKINWEILGNYIILTKKKYPHTTYTIKGKIIDTKNEPLPFVNVIVGNNHQTASDIHGAFIIKNIKPVNFKLTSSFIGYKTDTTTVAFGNNVIIQKTIILSPSTIQLQEAIVESDKIVRLTSISSMTLKNEDLQMDLNISNDPIKSINQIPAIATTGDLFNTNEVSIRGGEPTENKILLDNTTWIFPFYVTGNSIFNPDIIEKAEILTGGYQSTYGNAMSGIMNLTTKKGDLNHIKGNIGVNLIRTSALIEGPLQKGKSSFLMASRISNVGLYLENSIYPKLLNMDVFTKLFWKINDKHQLSFSTLNALDDFSYNGEFLGTDSVEYPITLHDRIGAYTIQLQSILSANVYNKFSTSLSTQQIKLDEVRPDYPSQFDFNNHTLFVRNDLSWYINQKLKIKTGFASSYSIFKGSEALLYDSPDINISDTTVLYLIQSASTEKSNNIAIYSNIEHKLNNRLIYNFGIRLDYLTHFNIIDVSPRLNLNYLFNKKLALKFATGVFYQAPFATELKNNPTLKSSQSNHYITGITYKFSPKNTLGIETYYKDYENVIIFDRNRNFSNNGKGNAKGIELFEQFNTKNITLKTGYTYALANRKRNLQPAVFPFYFEQKHRANLWVNFHPEKRLKKWLPSSYGLQFNYYTGTPYTPIISEDPTNIVFGNINSATNSVYHNLNLKLTWKYQIGKKKETDFTFFLEFWNLYNRKNFKERNYIIDNSPSGKVLKTNNEFISPLLPNLGLKIYFN